MIFENKSDARIFLALGATDMRKSINGLSQLVEQQFAMNLFTGNLFAFCNRRQDLIKILYWDGNGFCVWMKRLEEDHFRWPACEEDVMEIHASALSWLLNGLDLRQAHRPLLYESVS